VDSILSELGAVTGIERIALLVQSWHRDATDITPYLGARLHVPPTIRPGQNVGLIGPMAALYRRAAIALGLVWWMLRLYIL
jgi:hypothetical protein